jgi:hypothetical protein
MRCIACVTLSCLRRGTFGAGLLRIWISGREYGGGCGSIPIETTGSKVVDINKYIWEKHC